MASCESCLKEGKDLSGCVYCSGGESPFVSFDGYEIVDLEEINYYYSEIIDLPNMKADLMVI